MEIESISFGGFHLSPGERRLTSGGEPIAVGSRALDLLILLTLRPGSIVPTSEIMATVWGRAFVDGANLRTQIATLRRALGDDQRDPRYIVNVPGQGYCFVCPVRSNKQSSEPVMATPASPDIRKLGRLRIFGRDKTIATICAQVAQARILTIAGPGGIGKSTVARAVLERMGQCYDDGIVVIVLAPTASAEVVPTVFSSAFGYVCRTEEPIPELCGYLKNKNLLVLVDSCEHLIDAVTPWIETIAEEVSGITMLVTSREPLRAQGEQVHRLPALDSPPSSGVRSAAEALGFPAVELFVERARACLGDYEMSEEDAPFVSQICSRLDGIALAIELAAGRLETIGVRPLAASLLESFRLLTHGRRTALPRHKTLRATLDWSYELLAPDEKAALQELSVFKGHFTREGIERLVMTGRPDDDVEDAVFGLVTKSLVFAEPAAAGTKYRLLDTTRAYAMEKLAESGRHHVLGLRHAQYALEVFERAERELYDGRSSIDSGEWLPMLRSALEWGFGPGGDAQLGARLTIAAVPFFFQNSLLDECLRYVTRSIAYLEENPGLDERSRMKLYAALGWPQMLSTGNNGMAAWASALEIAEHIGDVDHQMRAVWAAWVDRLNCAEPKAALVFSDRFRELAAPSTDRMDAVLGVRLNGATMHWLGRQGEARAAMEQMLEAYVDPPICHAVRFQFDQRVTARIILARTLWLQGFADRALAEVRDTVDYATGIGHNLSLSNVLAEAACSVALWSGDEELAESYIGSLAEHTRADSLDVWHTYAACFNGMLLLARHRPAEGLGMLERGLESLRASGFVLFQTEFLGAKAQALLRLGQRASALQTVSAALQQCDSTGERWCLAELHRIKGEILVGEDRLDDSGAAMAEFDLSMQVAAHDGALAWRLRSAVNIARLMRDQGRGDSASLILSSVYDEFVEGFQTRDLKDASELLRSLCENQG